MCEPCPRGALVAAATDGRTTKGTTMSLFMDVHILGDPFSLADVAGAHAAARATQGAHDVH